MARKPSYNEDTAKRVREQALLDIEAVLKETEESKKFGAYKKQMLLAISKTVLPRVTELSGKDGGPIQVSGIEISIRK